MPVEIERKFLVTGDAWRQGKAIRIRQGYLSRHKERMVRVRLAGDKAYLAVKGMKSGAARAEYEYEIPVSHAQEMLKLCEGPIIDKMRYLLDWGGLTWEVDAFLGDNAGLIVAEVELDREDQPIELPEWVGEEVTHNPRYFNANLCAHPFCLWPKSL